MHVLTCLHTYQSPTALTFDFFFFRSFQSLYKPSPCSERRHQPGKISECTSASIHVPVKTTWSIMPLPVWLSWMTTNNLKTQDHEHWAQSECRISVAGFRVMCWKQSNHKIQTQKGLKECLLIMTRTHNMLIQSNHIKCRSMLLLQWCACTIIAMAASKFCFFVTVDMKYSDGHALFPSHML